MNNESIEDLTAWLQDLHIQRTIAEDTIEEISQESVQVEYGLMIVRSADRRDWKDATDLARPQSNTNTFKIVNLVRITNKDLSTECGDGNIASVGSF